MKVTLSKIKENSTENHQQGEEPRTQINSLEHKEEIGIQPEPEKKKRRKNNLKKWIV